MSESASGEADSNTEDAGKEFSCDECGKRYSSRGGYRYHLKQYHPDQLIACDICGDLMLSEKGVKTHKASKHGRTKVSLNCESCGEKFEVKPYRADTAQYCSYPCSTRETLAGWNKKDHSELVCERCGDTYTVPPHMESTSQFCSVECKNGPRAELECEYCGEVYDVALHKRDSSRYCGLECRDKAFRSRYSGEDSPVWEGGDVGYYGPNWFQQRRKARVKYQSRCQYCGTTPVETGKELSVHHVVSMREFKEQYDPPECYEKANQLENLVPLCGPCHKKWEGIPLKPELI